MRTRIVRRESPQQTNDLLQPRSKSLFNAASALRSDQLPLCLPLRGSLSAVSEWSEEALASPRSVAVYNDYELDSHSLPPTSWSVSDSVLHSTRTVIVKSTGRRKVSESSHMKSGRDKMDAFSPSMALPLSDSHWRVYAKSPAKVFTFDDYDIVSGSTRASSKVLRLRDTGTLSPFPETAALNEMARRRKQRRPLDKLPLALQSDDSSKENVAPIGASNNTLLLRSALKSHSKTASSLFTHSRRESAMSLSISSENSSVDSVGVEATDESEQSGGTVSVSISPSSVRFEPGEFESFGGRTRQCGVDPASIIESMLMDGSLIEACVSLIHAQPYECTIRRVKQLTESLSAAIGVAEEIGIISEEKHKETAESVVHATSARSLQSICECIKHSLLYKDYSRIESVLKLASEGLLSRPFVKDDKCAQLLFVLVDCSEAKTAKAIGSGLKRKVQSQVIDFVLRTTASDLSADTCRNAQRLNAIEYSVLRQCPFDWFCFLEAEYFPEFRNCFLPRKSRKCDGIFQFGDILHLAVACANAGFVDYLLTVSAFLTASELMEMIERRDADGTDVFTSAARYALSDEHSLEVCKEMLQCIHDYYTVGCQRAIGLPQHRFLDAMGEFVSNWQFLDTASIAKSRGKLQLSEWFLSFVNS